MIHLRVSNFRKYHWMTESGSIPETRIQLRQAIKLLAKIEHFEAMYRELISQSMGNAFDLAFPEMKRKTLHRAEICKRWTLKLRKEFNIIICEIQI